MKKSFNIKDLRKRVGCTLSEMVEGTDNLSVSKLNSWEVRSVRPNPEDLIEYFGVVADRLEVNKEAFIDEQLERIQTDVHLRLGAPFNAAYLLDLESARHGAWLADLSYQQPDRSDVPERGIHPGRVVADCHFTTVELANVTQTLAVDLSRHTKGVIRSEEFRARAVAPNGRLKNYTFRDPLISSVVDGVLSPQLQKSLFRLVEPEIHKLMKRFNGELEVLSEQLASVMEQHNLLVAAGKVESFESPAGHEEEHQRLQYLRDLDLPWTGIEISKRTKAFLREPLTALQAHPEGSPERVAYEAVLGHYERSRRARWSTEALVVISVLTRTPLYQLFLALMEQNRLTRSSSMSTPEVGRLAEVLEAVQGYKATKLIERWLQSLPPPRKFTGES